MGDCPAQFGESQLDAQPHQHRAHQPVEPVPQAGEAGAHSALAEQQCHQAEPQRRGERQVNAVAGLHRQRRVRVDHHGEQREEEQRGLGVQAIGDEASHEGATRRALGSIAEHIQAARRSRLGAQGLDADVEQVGRRQPLQRVEQHDGLRHDQADAEQRIGHMDEDAGAHAQRRPGTGTTAVGHALAYYDGEVRPRAGHGQQVDQRHGQKLRPVHATSE